MREEAAIAILLATYNGERYLAEQLQSIEKQTYGNWHVIISDDGSGDDTLGIAEKFRDQHAGRVTILRHELRPSSACENFFYLMDQCPLDYPYIMFCDQDDVWAEDKVERSFAAIQELEKGDSSTSCLVFSDAEVVDQDLGLISPSFLKYTGADPSRTLLSQLLVQNPITGAGVIVNAALLAKARSATDRDRIAMHDQWLGLVAACFGRIGFLDVPTFQYRQHRDNVAGAVRMSIASIGEKRRIARRSLDSKRSQAAQLLDAFQGYLSKKDEELLLTYCSFESRTKLFKISYCLKNNVLMSDMLRNLGLLIYI